MATTCPGLRRGMVALAALFLLLACGTTSRDTSDTSTATGGGVEASEPASKPSEALPDTTDQARPTPNESPQKNPSKPAKPNIVLLFVDTLRFDHLSIYGYGRKTSPNIDRWLGSGTIFQWAHATGPATRFSVPPMLFGKHYTEIVRSRGHWPRIDDSEIGLGERMQKLGYHTAAVHTIHYFREKFNMHRGWDHWDTSCLQWRNPKRRKNPKWKHVKARRCEWSLRTADWVTDRAITHIDAANLSQSNKPWLLWAYYSDPHAPYISYDKSVPSFGPWYTDRYDQEIWFADHHIGRLLEAMDKRGLLDNAIIVLTSDHGEGLSRGRDHGRLLHSSTLFENLLRIPMIFGGKPEVRQRYGMASRRVATPVSLLDVLPTFLEAAGMARTAFPKHFRGVSLWPWIRGENPEHPPLFFEKHRAEDPPQKAMLDWPFKLIANVDQHWRWSLYNLAEDPNEKRNLRYRMEKAKRDVIWKRYVRWRDTVLTPAASNPLN